MLLRAELPGCLPPSAGLSDPRNRTPAPRAASFAASCQTLCRALSHPSPRSQSFRLRMCRTILQFPVSPALLAPFWRFGGTPRYQGPWRLQAESWAARYTLPAAGLAPAATRGCDFLGTGWQERGALRGFGADLPRRKLRTAQNPRPAASSLSPLILHEKRKRCVGAETPGGVGRGRRGVSRPKGSGESCGAAARAPAQPVSRAAHLTRVPAT